MNINEFIFSRTQPQKKIDTINALTKDELLSINKATVKRIVKEAGRKMGRTRDKEMRIAYERRNGNAWNSNVECVDLIKNKLYIDLYCQFSSTDSTICEDFDEFFARGNYFIYDLEAKANVAKAILLEYVFTKYAAKLTQQAA